MAVTVVREEVKKILLIVIVIKGIVLHFGIYRNLYTPHPKDHPVEELPHKRITHISNGSVRAFCQKRSYLFRVEPMWGGESTIFAFCPKES
jgi:hypothetical protein